MASLGKKYLITVGETQLYLLSCRNATKNTLLRFHPDFEAVCISYDTLTFRRTTPGRLALQPKISPICLADQLCSISHRGVVQITGLSRSTAAQHDDFRCKLTSF
jgi:hypothetical protein